MLTVPEYVPYLLAGQVAAARAVGVEPYYIDRQAWVMNLAVLDLIGMIVKALNDKAIVLDAEWLVRLNSAYAGVWDQNMIAQIQPAP